MAKRKRKRMDIMDVSEMVRFRKYVYDVLVVWQEFCGELYDVIRGKAVRGFIDSIQYRFFELMEDMELIVMDLERVDVSILERYGGILSDRCKVIRNDLDSILRGNYEGFRDDEVSSINSFLSVALDDIYNLLEVAIENRRARE